MLPAVGGRMSDDFFWVYQFSPAQSGGWRGGPLPWHLRAALVLLPAGRGSSRASGTPSAGLRFCYYLNPSRVGFCGVTVGPRSPRASPARLPADEGVRAGLTVMGGPQPCPPPSEAPLFSANCDQGPADAHRWLGATPTRGPFPGSSGVPSPGWEPRLVTLCPCFRGPGARARVEGGSGDRGAWCVLGSPPVPVGPRAHRLHRGGGSSPFQSPKFTGCGISAQSHWRCVLEFLLSFQIFF